MLDMISVTKMLADDGDDNALVRRHTLSVTDMSRPTQPAANTQTQKKWIYRNMDQGIECLK